MLLCHRSHVYVIILGRCIKLMLRLLSIGWLVSCFGLAVFPSPSGQQFRRHYSFFLFFGLNHVFASHRDSNSIIGGLRIKLKSPMDSRISQSAPSASICRTSHAFSICRPKCAWPLTLTMIAFLWMIWWMTVFFRSTGGHTSTPLPHGFTVSALLLVVASKLIPSPNEARPVAFPHDGLGCVQS